MALNNQFGKLIDNIAVIPFAGPFGLVVLPIILLAWLGPYAMAFLTGSKNAPVQTQSIQGVVTQPDDTRALVGGYHSILKLEYPSSIKVSQTCNVRAWLEPDPSAPRGFAGKLESQDFKIVAGNPGDAASQQYQYEWDWLISPGETGDRALYFWVEPSTELLLISSAGDARVAPSRNRVYLPISVRTARGLTPAQEGWAEVVGGGLGLIGTVAGYSFWKSRKKNDEHN